MPPRSGASELRLVLALAAVAGVATAAGCNSDSRDAQANGPPPAARGCAQRVEGPSRPADARRDLRVGPLTFYGLKLAGRQPLTREAPRELVTYKSLLTVRAGAPVTLSIAPQDAKASALLYRARFRNRYTSLSEGDRAIVLTPCRPSTPRRLGHGVVGRVTQFNGGFLLARPTCVSLTVTRRGSPTGWQADVAFGRKARPCRH